uniref:Amino acid transporter transmembrane domain-containing protein n=1 Tax=Meloidogyne javanica TaxID=6303 RepID=A0A915MGG4_MELJA
MTVNAEKSNGGLNWFVTGLFIVAQLAGGVMACSTSIMLGKCWLILQRRWPVIYKDNHCREPYPEICMRALGPRFKWAAVLSAGTTTIAVILICFGTLMDSSVCAKISVGMPPNNKFSNYFLALGTFLFSYGGHPGFPTIQHDMKKPKEFTKASIIAFLILSMLYLPVCILGYIVYGNSLRESIMNSIQNVWIQHTASFLITGHAIFSIIIVINPINQIAEKKFFVPQEFGPFRIIVRGIVLFLVVLVAESIPTFGPLLDLSGGSTQTSTALIYPFFGILGGGAATFTAIRELTYTHFVPPCYISVFMDKQKNEVNF